ncbi:MAG: hypothetical protein HY075_09110, partial [Deltaproteobacteria bacterium]|nr:hypothetical protein [Deltaproteobacteria bacterium]
ALAARLLDWLGYPAAADAKSKATLELLPEHASRFTLEIEGDENLDADHAPSELAKQWHATNQDLGLPDGLELRVRETAKGARRYVVSGPVDQPLRLRPWLPGTRHLELRYKDATTGEWRRRRAHRDEDFVSVRDFPAGSLLVAEAHTQGLPFIHGFGINFFPLMDKTEERAEDPLTGLAGPAFYRWLPWNRATGWGELVFLN